MRWTTALNFRKKGRRTVKLPKEKSNSRHFTAKDMSSSKFRMMGQESMRKKSKTLRGPNSCLMTKRNFRKKKHFNCSFSRAFRPVRAFPTFQEEELGWMRSVRTSNPSGGRFSSRVNWVKARPFRLNCRSPWRSSKGCWFR